MTEKPRRQDQYITIREFAGTFMRDTSKVYSNLGQEIILITEDKIRICLMEHLSRVEKRWAWATPLGMLVTILAVFPTTTFRDSLGLEATTWKAFFMIGAVVCFGWFIIAAWRARTSTSINSVIADIKKTTISTQPSEAAPPGSAKPAG